MCIRIPLIFRLFSAVFAIGIFARPAAAETLTWGIGGAGGPGTWDTTTANWYNGISDVTWGNDGAYFTGVTGSTVTIAAPGVTANTLTFNTFGYLVASSTLTLANAATITTQSVDAGINSIITGSAGLVKAGSGFLILGGANTYTGGTTISAGTLQIGNGGAGGILPGDVVNNAVLAFNRSNTQTYAGAISGSGEVTKAGTGTQILTGTNSYAGQTSVTNGTLLFGNAAALSASTSILLSGTSTVGFSFAPLDQTLLGRLQSASQGTVAITEASNSNALDFAAAALPTVSLGATGISTYSGVLTPSGTTYRLGGGGGALTVTSALSGANELALFSGLSGGTVILPNANTHSGGTVINSGTVAIGDNGALGTGTLTFGNQGMLRSTGGARTISNPVVLPNVSGNSALIGGNDAITFTGPMSLSVAGNGLRSILTTNTRLTQISGGLTMTYTGVATGQSPNLGFVGTGDIEVNSPLVSTFSATTYTASNVFAYLPGSTVTISGTGNAWGNGNSRLEATAESTVRIASPAPTWNGVVPNPAAPAARQLFFTPRSGGKITYDLGPLIGTTSATANAGINTTGGTFELIGKSTGTSSLTMVSSFFVYIIGDTTIKIDPNGGAGTSLILNSTSTLGWRTDLGNKGFMNSVLLDASAPGANFVSSGAIISGTATPAPLPLKNGIGSWNVVIKDTTGNIGYATTENPGDVVSNIVRYTGATTLTPTSTGTATNYITSGNLTIDPGVNPSYSTLQINTTGGGTLDLGGDNLVSSRSILVTGSDDYVIQNGTLKGGLHPDGSQGPAMALHYGTGVLTIAAQFETFAGFTKTGPGLVHLTGTNTNLGSTTISGGVLRAVQGVGLSQDSALVLGGGILETSGTLTRSLGTGVGNLLAWTNGVNAASGGFAGYSENPDPASDPLIILIGGTNASPSTWGTESSVFLQSGAALLLNSKTANTMVDYRNTLALGSAIPRVIDVADNPNLTTDFARISGVITGATAPLYKTGAGLLELTGSNNYAAATIIAEGTISTPLLANGGVNSGIGSSSSAASNLVITGTGTLKYTGSGTTSDRLFTVGTGGAAIDASGSGALVLNNTGAMGLDALNSANSIGARTLTLTGTNTLRNTLAAAIGDQSTNATSLTKTGLGTWVLSGTSSYSGDTTVSEGTLLVSSSGVLNAVGDVNVAANAAFGGGGSVGEVLVSSLATLLLEPDTGDTNGLTATQVTLNDDSIMRFSLGTTNGMLTVSNFLAGGGMTNIDLQLNYTGTGLTVGQTLTLVDYTSTTFNTSNVSQFTVSSIGAGPVTGTLFWDVPDSSLKFTVDAIPEPSTWVLLGLGVTFVAARRRIMNVLRNLP